MAREDRGDLDREDLGGKPGSRQAQSMRDLARKVRRALDEARPEVDRVARQAAPHLDRAVRGALDFAREHDDEIKRAALRAARSFAPRPLRPALHWLERARSIRPTPPRRGEQLRHALKCGCCGLLNPLGAKYCSECGRFLL